jgi:hypothetical protein
MTNYISALSWGDVPVVVIDGCEISKVFDGIIIRNNQPPRDSPEILNGSGVMVYKINLFIRLDDLNAFSLFKNLHYSVNTFYITA